MTSGARVWSERRRKLALAAAGLGADQALRVWVLIHEQPDGTWGAGGKIMRYTGVAGLATDGDMSPLSRRTLASGTRREPGCLP